MWEPNTADDAREMSFEHSIHPEFTDAMLQGTKESVGNYVCSQGCSMSVLVPTSDSDHDPSIYWIQRSR